MVVMLSFWRNDEATSRALRARAQHLLLKLGALRWLWAVGDSSDDTEALLRKEAGDSPRVTIVRTDTGIVGDDPLTRLRRFSATANAALDSIRESDDRVLIHESDLTSPRDIVARLDSGPDSAVAGWPTLTIGGQTVMYDSFGYRAQGRSFEGSPPYHAVYRPDTRFEVESVGSVWSMPASPIRAGARCHDFGCIGLCHDLRSRGVRIWVDPTVPIVQPSKLWTPAEAPPLPAWLAGGLVA